MVVSSQLKVFAASSAVAESSNPPELAGGDYNGTHCHLTTMHGCVLRFGSLDTLTYQCSRPLTYMLMV